MRRAPVKVFTNHRRSPAGANVRWSRGKVGEVPETVKPGQPEIACLTPHLEPARASAYAAAVPTAKIAHIEVHLFRRRRARPEFLLLRRAPDRTLGGVWQPVTGGIEARETAWRAAAREVLEETGLIPIRWWALEHLTSFYSPARDAIQIVPVFAAEVAWTDTVLLSKEHDRYAFVSAATATRRVLWGTQRRAIAAVREEVFAGGPGASAREITERKQQEAQIHHLAHHDLLTGLPNRAMFFDRLEAAIDEASAESRKLALMFVDLDRFKPVNDRHGHAVGDQLLQAVAGRMHTILRAGDLVGRIGGDEFIVLLHDIRTEDDALTAAEKLRCHLETPFDIEGRRLQISASIGIALYPSHADNARELARRADEAMYLSKAEGRNLTTLYSPGRD